MAALREMQLAARILEPNDGNAHSRICQSSPSVPTVKEAPLPGTAAASSPQAVTPSCLPPALQVSMQRPLLWEHGMSWVCSVQSTNMIALYKYIRGHQQGRGRAI